MKDLIALFKHPGFGLSGPARETTAVVAFMTLVALCAAAAYFF